MGPHDGVRRTTAPTGVGAVDLVAHQVTHARRRLGGRQTYHFRVVASSAGGTSYGEDRTFTDDRRLDRTPTRCPPSGEARPELGERPSHRSVRGIVRVKLPGSKRYVTLDDLGALPADATVDVRHGMLRLSTPSTPPVARRPPRFKGAVFRLGLRRPAWSTSS